MDDNKSGGYELTILFALLFRTAVDDLHKELDKMGFDDVRPSHGFVFQRLTPNGATGVELAEHMGITKQAASVMIDYLETRGYVSRQPHPHDRRGKLIVLTQRGWACIHATESIFSEIENRWAVVLGNDRMDELRSDLRRLALSSNEPAPLRIRPVW